MDDIIFFPHDCPPNWLAVGYERGPLTYELEHTYKAKITGYSADEKYTLPCGREIKIIRRRDDLKGRRNVGTLFVMMPPEWWKLPQELSAIMEEALLKGARLEPILTRADIAAYESFNDGY